MRKFDGWGAVFVVSDEGDLALTTVGNIGARFVIPRKVPSKVLSEVLSEVLSKGGIVPLGMWG